MKKIFFYCSFLVFIMSACGQSPEVKIHVYSRITYPGIRPDTGNDNPIFPKTYFIYAEVKKATKIDVEGYWIDGKYYAANGLEKVSTPVIMAEQAVITEQKDTLVKKTSNDVYQVVTGEEISRMPADDAEKKSVAESQFVLVIKVNGKLQFVDASKIKELPPLAMM